MRRIEFLELLVNLFQFKTVHDEKGNEYVLFSDNPINSAVNVQDHTAFEAIQNHVHLLVNIQKDELQKRFGLSQGTKDRFCGLRPP